MSRLLIAVNPGTAPVDGGTLEQARVNMEVFATDVAAEHGYQDAPVIGLRSETPDGDGDYLFTLTFGDNSTVDIDMPGLPTDQVRYLGHTDQNIWDFQRIWVAGSSWVWVYAVGQYASEL